MGREFNPVSSEFYIKQSIIDSPTREVGVDMPTPTPEEREEDIKAAAKIMAETTGEMTEVIKKDKKITIRVSKRTPKNVQLEPGVVLLKEPDPYINPT